MRQDVPALIFGPNLPPGGTNATLSISTVGVEVSVGGEMHRVPINQITLREVGFDRPGVELAWRDGDELWAAHVLDSTAASRLLNASALAATAQVSRLKATTRKAVVGRSIGMALLAAVLIAPVLVLLWFVVNATRIAGWIAERIPVEQEVALGRQAFAGMRATLTLNDEGPAYDAVRSIVARLTSGSRYRYEVHVAEDETLNAFALPGGVIVVHTGLIDATTRPEELAGVLAHEVQHVELRHSLRGLIQEMGLRGLWSYATGDLGATLGGQAALELTSLSFSRDAEREADQRGLDALAAAGIDPAGMPAFFKVMSQKARDAPVAFMSTHPSSAERERELRQRVEALGSQPFAPMAFSPWPPVP
jgi:predicted Zn-dependent protease